MIDPISLAGTLISGIDLINDLAAATEIYILGVSAIWKLIAIGCCLQRPQVLSMASSPIMAGCLNIVSLPLS